MAKPRAQQLIQVLSLKTRVISYLDKFLTGSTGLRDKNSFYHGSIGYRNLLEFETISELFLDFGRKLRFKDFDYYKANITKEKPKYTQLFCFF